MSWPACPTCGAGTLVVDSRPTGDSGERYEAVRRRYVCRGETKHRWTTMETLAVGVVPLKDRPLTVGEVTKSYGEWAKEAGIALATLQYRILRGMDPLKAVKKTTRIPSGKFERVLPDIKPRGGPKS